MALLASEAHFLFEISGIKLGVAEFTAREEISSPCEVNLSLVSEDEINFDDVIGKEALLTILGDDADRYFHGVINKLSAWIKRFGFFLFDRRFSFHFTYPFNKVDNNHPWYFVVRII